MSTSIGTQPVETGPANTGGLDGRLLAEPPDDDASVSRLYGTSACQHGDMSQEWTHARRWARAVLVQLERYFAAVDRLNVVLHERS